MTLAERYCFGTKIGELEGYVLFYYHGLCAFCDGPQPFTTRAVADSTQDAEDPGVQYVSDSSEVCGVELMSQLCQFGAGICDHSICQKMTEDGILPMKQEQRVNLHLNVYKATFEYVKRGAGSNTYQLADIDPEETLVASPDFGSACSLAEEVAKELLNNRRFTHLTEIRVRDVVLLHAGVRLR